MVRIQPRYALPVVLGLMIAGTAGAQVTASATGSAAAANRGAAGDGSVQVRVEDRGIGIDPRQLEKIFERFYQADATSRRPYPGVGLGLFVCREIVNAHGGRIWAENRPWGGSAFVFELPLGPIADREDSS